MELPVSVMLTMCYFILVQATAVRANEQIDFIPGLSAVRVRDLPEGVVFGDLDSAISVAVHRMGQQLHRASAVVLNTFTRLQPSAVESDFSSIFNKFLPVGPLHLLSPRPSDPDDSNCLAWLNHHVAKSVAYIAFGSLLTPPPSELAALAEGLEESGVPFLWSLKESGRENLPRGFVDRTAGRGLVVPWTPQVEVLGHPAVGAFVTHAGWNSVMESVTAGVPLACRPFFGDQRLIARTVESVWRNGVSFDGEAMTRDTVVRALNKILKSSEGKKLKEKAEELKVMAAAAAADSGSSVESFKTLLKMVLKPKD